MYIYIYYIIYTLYYIYIIIYFCFKKYVYIYIYYYTHIMMYIHHKPNGWPIQMNQLNGFVLAMWPCHPMFRG